MAIRSLYFKYKEMVLYVLWGAATTAVNYGAYFLFTRLWNLHLVAANSLAWLISMLFAFWANKTFVFDSKSWALSVAIPELSKFAGARFFSGVLETGILWLCVDNWHFHDGITKLVASVLVVILNYVFSKLFIFHKEQ